jgi:predicted transposase YdaD
MKGKEGEEAERVLQESITVVSKIKNEALRQDLLAVMGILAGGKYAAEVVYSMIRREMVMQSPVYQEWAKEERIEGRIEEAREAICKFMVRRFGADPDEITQKIGQISSLEILDKLM